MNSEAEGLASPQDAIVPAKESQGGFNRRVRGGHWADLDKNTVTLFKLSVILSRRSQLVKFNRVTGAKPIFSLLEAE
jgi:hypothetical protein